MKNNPRFSSRVTFFCETTEKHKSWLFTTSFSVSGKQSNWTFFHIFFNSFTSVATKRQLSSDFVVSVAAWKIKQKCKLTSIVLGAFVESSIKIDLPLVWMSNNKLQTSRVTTNHELKLPLWWILRPFWFFFSMFNAQEENSIFFPVVYRTLRL